MSQKEWVRQGVSFNPETHEEFKDIIGSPHASASRYYRDMEEAFVAVHGAAMAEGLYIPPHQVIPIMQHATIKFLQERIDEDTATTEDLVPDE